MDELLSVNGKEAGEPWKKKIMACCHHIVFRTKQSSVTRTQCSATFHVLENKNKKTKKNKKLVGILTVLQDLISGCFCFVPGWLTRHLWNTDLGTVLRVTSSTKDLGNTVGQKIITIIMITQSPFSQLSTRGVQKANKR